MNYRILFPEGRKKAFTLSYDDGQCYDRQLVDLFNRYELKATFHLNAGTLDVCNDETEFIKKDEVKKLYAGHEIACHGYTHPWFSQLTHSRLVAEILDDRRELERLTGFPVRGMSYPFGDFSETICATARTLGIEYSRTVENTNEFHIPKDFMKWHPTCHHSADVFSLTEKFLNPMPYLDLQLFYVWGHSFEFHRENNWDRMEHFCEKISGREDIWYATNIQIKEYLCAAQNLIATTEHQVVYNPSALTIWIEADGQKRKIHAGETLTL